MHCPFCHAADTSVTDTRLNDDGDCIRRRRRCRSCQRRFSTHEQAEITFPPVVKRNGSRVEFNRHKLNASLRLALRKRPVPTSAVTEVIISIEEWLLSCGEKEVPSAQIGQAVMDALKKLDAVAYVRFASVYRNFSDVTEFSSALRDLNDDNQA